MAYNTDVFVFKNFIIINVFYYLFILIFVYYLKQTSDEESIEEKDHFVAQLFKFMDDRGTPINEVPVINDMDVDLYKLFKVLFFSKFY